MKRDIIDLTGEPSVQPAKKPKTKAPMSKPWMFARKPPIEAFARVKFDHFYRREPHWEMVITGGHPKNTPDPIIGCGGFKLATKNKFIEAYSINVGIFRSKTLGDTYFSKSVPTGLLNTPTLTHYCVGLEFTADAVESIYSDDPEGVDNIGFEDLIHEFFSERMDFRNEALHWTNFPLYTWRRFYFMFRNRETRGIPGRADSLQQLGTNSQFYDPTLTPWERQLQNLPRVLVAKIFEYWYDGGISMVYFGDLAWNPKFIDQPKITASNFSAILDEQAKVDDFAAAESKFYAPIHFLTSDNHHWFHPGHSLWVECYGKRYGANAPCWAGFKKKCANAVGCDCCNYF